MSYTVVLLLVVLFKDGGAVTFADVYSVFPFDDTLVTITLTGASR